MALAAALVLAAVVAPALTPALARAAAADSLADATRASASAGRAAAPAPARADTTRRRPWHEQPRFVMARSLLFPGWGQLHNHAWWKALLLMGGEGWLGAQVVDDQHRLDRLLGDIAAARAIGDRDRENELVNEYNSRLDQRLSRQWMLGGVIAYALVDAYVDANFRGFDVEFKKDPALPAGTSPAGPTGGGDGPGVRLALRWTF